MTIRQQKKAKSSTTAELENLFAGADQGPERLAKRIASAGLCSRRDAEKWIEAGRVEINGRKHTSPAHNVTAEDDITVDGKPLPKKAAPRLWRYYKPRGLIVSHRDEQGRQSVFDALPPDLPRVVSVGRLDLDSEGLILLTTSGALARHLELPSTGWSRKYRVRVHGRVDTNQLADLAEGITIEGVRYQGIKASLDRQGTSNAWLTMVLKEGKNREIRRVMEHLGYRVSRLIRTSYGPFSLNTLEEGEVEEIKSAILRDQLGLERKPGQADPTPAKPKQPRQNRQRKTAGKANRPPSPGGKKGMRNAHHQRQKARRPAQRS